MATSAGSFAESLGLRGGAMTARQSSAWLIAILSALALAGLNRSRAIAQEQITGSLVPGSDRPGVCCISLDEAKQRALANSRLRSLACMNIQAKQEAVFVMEADYYPKLFANFTGLHFDEPLGKVLVPRLPLPSVAVNVFNQDFGMTSLTAVQPITALLKVHQGVIVMEADQRIAESQAEQADRAIASGVEQLYCGLLAAQRILAAAQLANETAAKMPPAMLQTIEARIAAVEGKQAIQAVSAQAGELEEQLNGMLDLPLTTKLELVDLPPVEAPRSVRGSGDRLRAVLQSGGLSGGSGHHQGRGRGETGEGGLLARCHADRRLSQPERLERHAE
jgi:hypothetical protein